MPLLFLVKYVLGASAMVGLFIGIHQAFEGWKSGLVNAAIVEQELAARDKQIKLLSEANEIIAAEVEWERDYAQKQKQTIDRLREQASVEAQECFDLPIDRGFIK